MAPDGRADGPISLRLRRGIKRKRGKIRGKKKESSKIEETKNNKKKTKKKKTKKKKKKKTEKISTHAASTGGLCPLFIPPPHCYTIE